MRIAVAALLLATACAAHDTVPAATSSPSPTASALPMGKFDVPLDPGRYASPDGFTPRVTLALDGTGWRTSHRYEDFFDVGRPEPGQDIPRLAIAFSRPSRPDAASVVADVRAAQPKATTAAATVAGRSATAIDVVGGSGEAYRGGNLGLYADTDQHLRLYVLDGAVPLVVAVTVPHTRNWAAESARAATVLATVTIEGT